MNRYGRVIKSQATTTERSQISVSQQYCWHIMIEAEWEYLQRTKSPRDIFNLFAHHFQLNLDEYSLLCDEGKLNVLGINDKPHHEKLL